MTTQDLRKLHRTYKRALARAEGLRAQRDAAIATVVAEGTSQAEVARILGVSRAHVGHIMERTAR